MPIKILFVCLGNICRSPTAEAVMNSLIQQHKLESDIVCDSAGTIGFHAGEKADARMRQHASKRGYDLISRSRQFEPDVDFDEFDYIITMDDNNYSDVSSMDRLNQYTHKIHKMGSYCQFHNVAEIPDPYYGGSDGFNEILNLLEDACQGLLNKTNDEY